MPPMAAATYSTISESAIELMAQAMAQSRPPTSTTMRGPNLSTNQPSTGTSHVSVTTKIVNATWMPARLQPYFWAIGSTNSVQPYCRLATIAMQMTPMTNCSQRPPIGPG